MKLELKLIHNIRLSFDYVKIKMYIYGLQSQITVYVPRHKVRTFIPYTPNIGRCL